MSNRQSTPLSPVWEPWAVVVALEYIHLWRTLVHMPKRLTKAILKNQSYYRLKMLIIYCLSKWLWNSKTAIVSHFGIWVKVHHKCIHSSVTTMIRGSQTGLEESTVDCTSCKEHKNVIAALYWSVYNKKTLRKSISQTKLDLIFYFLWLETPELWVVKVSL